MWSYGNFYNNNKLSIDVLSFKTSMISAEVLLWELVHFERNMHLGANLLKRTNFSCLHVLVNTKFIYSGTSDMSDWNQNCS